MTPSGESLKILARDLGTRVYTKYSIRQKQQNQILEKLSTIYNAYTGVLAKDTKVNEVVQVRLLVSFLVLFQNILASVLCQECQILPREKWCKLELKQSAGPSLQGGETQWPYIVTLELGTYMVDMMVKNLKINSNILNPDQDRKLIPVLYHMYTFRSTRQVKWMSAAGITSCYAEVQINAF